MWNMKQERLALTTSVAVLTLSAATANSFEISWYTVDGGGALQSTGGTYALSGSIGQPDAGRVTGGSYALTGGFWAVGGAGAVQACTTMVSADPPNCEIDARQPHDVRSVDPAQGIDRIVVSFAGPCATAALTAADFSLDVTPGPIGALAINVVQAQGNDVVIGFNQVLSPGHWTCVTFVPGGQRTCVGYLPGDVNASRASTAADITALINSLNNVPGFVRPLFATDANRSGGANASDILRVIDLLNGAGVYSQWLNATLPACPTAP